MMLSIAERAELARLLELKNARSNFLDFVTFTKSDYQVNWHHKLFADTLNRFLFTNEIPRLMIFAPPRHGKSELISRRFPAFAFGCFPKLKIISTSYGADLASQLNRDVQRIIEDPSYQKIFPKTFLNSSNVRTAGNWLRNSDIFEIVGHSGVFRCAGVGGPITGSGADILLIDDPIKNQEEANSQTYRQKVWDWYATTAYTRLENDLTSGRVGKVCLTVTRWHEGDLAGKLLAEAQRDPKADQWHVLSLPALAEGSLDAADPREQGAALWPNKYNADRLAAMRATVGNQVFNALFQQRPSSPEGGIFKRSDWARYDYNEREILRRKMDTIVQSWDLAFKKATDSDFVAGHVWGKMGGAFYLLDRFCDRVSFTGSLSAVANMSAKWPEARAKYVEAKANGEALVDVLKREIPGLILVEPKGGKTARAMAVSPFVESGAVHIPLNPAGDAIIETAAGFPNVDHDDDIDAMSQALLKLGDSPIDRLKKLLGEK